MLDQLADAGIFFLTFSGGEMLMRRDFFELLEYARHLMFSVRIKTNAVMIGEAEARRMLELGVDQVQVSIYSHRPEVHDAITKLPGSLRRSIEAIRFLAGAGTASHHRQCSDDGQHARPCRSPGPGPRVGGSVHTRPHHHAEDGRGPLDPESAHSGLGIEAAFFTTKAWWEMSKSFALRRPLPDEDAMEGYPCSAGHTLAYISPYGDVFPCVQFPLPSGNVRRQKFLDIWNHSTQLNEVRSIRARDLHGVLDLQPRRHLHALSRPRLHGGKYARALDRRLREVIPAHRNPVREYASPEQSVPAAPLIHIQPLTA